MAFRFVHLLLFCQSELITHVGWICSSGAWWLLVAMRVVGTVACRGRCHPGGRGQGKQLLWWDGRAAPRVRSWGFASRVKSRSQNRLTSNRHTTVCGT